MYALIKIMDVWMYLIKKHEEAKLLTIVREEKSKLEKQAMEFKKTLSTKEEELRKLQSEVTIKEERIQQQQKTIEKKEVTIKDKENTIESLQNEAVINQAAARANTEDVTRRIKDDQGSQSTDEQNKLLNALASQTKRLVDNIRTKDDAENINRVHRTRIEMVQPFHGLHTKISKAGSSLWRNFNKQTKLKTRIC